MALGSIISIVASLAPTIAGIFTSGSKGTTLVGEGIKILGNLLNKPGASPGELERDIQEMATYKEVELKRLEIEFQLAMRALDVNYALQLQVAGLELARANVQLNQWDARSRDKYRNRWRPTLMWGGVICLIFAMVLKFLVPAILLVGVTMGITEQTTVDTVHKILGSLDTAFLFQIMLPLLGIGFAVRGYEKTRGQT